MKMFLALVISTVIAGIVIVPMLRNLDERLPLKEEPQNNKITEKKDKKMLCPTCLTGAESYKIDKNSPVCPYLHSYRRKRCPFYKPLNENDRA